MRLTRARKDEMDDFAAALASSRASEEPETAPEEAAPPPPSGSYRCKLCGAKSATFAVAHEHASAEHELAGHQIDDSIVKE